MNNKGMSFIETILSLAIFMLIIGSLIPLSYQLKTTLNNKKIDYHASEVALDAAKIIKSTGQTKGTKMIDQVEYDWYFDGDEICVTYENFSLKKKCINKK